MINIYNTESIINLQTFYLISRLNLRELLYCDIFADNLLIKILNISEFNPLNGIYQIDENISNKLSSFIDLDFNFNKYKYSINSSTY